MDALVGLGQTMTQSNLKKCLQFLPFRSFMCGSQIEYITIADFSAQAPQVCSQGLLQSLTQSQRSERW